MITITVDDMENSSRSARCPEEDPASMFDSKSLETKTRKDHRILPALRVVFVSLCWLTYPAELTMAQPVDLLQQAEDARIANESKITTAHGIGRLTYVVHEAGQSAPVTVQDSDVEFFYDQNRFRIHLVHNAKLFETVRPADEDKPKTKRWVPSDLAEQIVIYDGKKVIAVDFLTDATCRGKIYFGVARDGVMRSAGFPFQDPIFLYSQALDLTSSDIRRTAKLTILDNGGFLGVMSAKTWRMKFFFLGKFGYDLRRVSSYRTGETQPFRDYLMNWEETNGVQYVQRFLNTVTSAHGNTGSSQQTTKRLSLEYRSFEANQAIDPRWFLLESVNVPNGAIFLDKRAQVLGGPAELVMVDSVLEGK